ncbi:unnamed protein product [Larinioides sclopetarius]|uniref:Saccharopine dehydrogenase NADP binding domain-containing protein n=1 Tax=Larinioides sclopetarius TaxID=280406 RepID=A0AAV1ZYP2_9ARAC
MSKDSKEFDLVIFGASGLTGRYAIEELARSVVKFPDIKWAVAGRNAEKLREALVIVQEYLSDETDIRGTQMILADSQDPTSIYKMCQRTKLLLNCVGPYNLCGGEMIASTCVECKTHSIDISAEIKYLDTVLANYFEQARNNGVYIIEACGFGSLPADYGITLLMKKFSGGLNSVEYFAEFGEGPSGKPIGCGTYLSIVDSLVDYLKPAKFEKEVEEKVFKKMPNKLKQPNSKYDDFRDLSMTYSYKERSWCVKYFGPDERSIKRSQMIRASYLNSEEYIEVQGYLKFPSLYEALRHFFVIIFSIFMSLFSVGRILMKKYPYFFSAGLFSKEGPSRQQIMESFTKVTFYADGWEKKVSDSEKQVGKPDKKIKLTITGPEVGYVLTTMCMVQAALTVLHDSDKMPFKGGVYTPGVAFENTRLQDRLEKRGMTFTFEDI